MSIKVTMIIPAEAEGVMIKAGKDIFRQFKKKVFYSASEVEDAAVPAATRRRGGVRAIRAIAAEQPVRGRRKVEQVAGKVRGIPVVAAPNGGGRNSVVYQVTPAGQRMNFSGVRGVIVTYLTRHPGASAAELMERLHTNLAYPSAEAARKSVESAIHNLRTDGAVRSVAVGGGR